jgi:formate/nitrite transporter FocA (FNT family)
MSQSPTPSRQHLAAYEVLPTMKREAEYFLTRTAGQTLVSALAGGMFVTLGALFSLLL